MKTNVLKNTSRISKTHTSLLLSVFFLFTMNIPINAQSVNISSITYGIEDKVPEYPGGMKAMNEYIYANQQYPEDALKEKIQGRVMAQFIVNADGSLSDIKIIGSLCPSLDAEAVRLIENMPRWRPAIYKGQVVQLEYAVPIIFKLPPT